MSRAGTRPIPASASRLWRRRALAVVVLIGAGLVVVALGTPWKLRSAPRLAETTADIGNAFLKQWLLPFELASLILLATLIGAIVIARKELKAD